MTRSPAAGIELVVKLKACVLVARLLLGDRDRVPRSACVRGQMGTGVPFPLMGGAPPSRQEGSGTALTAPDPICLDRCLVAVLLR